MPKGTFGPEQVCNGISEVVVNKAEELFGGLFTEKQHTEHFDRQTSENGTVSSSHEQSDSSGYWDESGIVDKNTVVENSFIPENSVFMRLGKLLTESEKILIDEFHGKMENIVETFHKSKHESSTKVALESMEHLIDEYLKKKIKLNLRCDGYEYTVSNFVFSKIIDIANVNSAMRITPTTRSRYKDNGEEAIDEWTESEEPLFNIVDKLLSAGAKIESDFYGNSMVGEVTWGNDEPIFAKCEKIKNELKSIAYKGLVNKDEHAQDDDLTVEVDNNLVFFQWPQNSIIEVAKIMSSKVGENFNIESSILQIGESIIRVESVGEKRNYTDVLEGSIEMSFTTEIGKIVIYLSPSDEGSNKIKVEVSNKKEILEKFKNCKEKLGKNCLLGGLSVNEAIEQGFFDRSGKSMRSEAVSQSNRKTEESWCERINRASNSEQTISCTIR